MNKKISLIVLFLIIISIVLSGCLNESNSLEINLDSSGNNYPFGKIIAPDEAYFDDSIKFDATNSYDSDGDIVSYYWTFGDGEIAEGRIVKHTYKFEKDLNINYPLIYTTSLLVMDNKGATIGVSHEIKVYPNKYNLYFKPGGFELEKPSFSEDYVKTAIGIVNSDASRILTYEFENSINISACLWNAMLYLSKPRFTRVTKIKMVLYDDNDIEISQAEKYLGIFKFWNKKTIELNGKIDRDVEFKSVRLFVYGFSLSKKISISYGSDKASNICLNFKK
ncbi:MAG: PKD domain-containing protein [Thermoplasmatales archaeon]|nr:MAG: PKD domain-containing protein [Thermoplasmatales archaeon]